MHGHPVVFLPGGVMAAGPAYAALLRVLDDDVDARVKDLEVYARSVPPPDYALATEIEGIARLADEAAFERFHLVGYSAGGAAGLAFTAVHPERLLSLALLEPAFAGWQAMTPEERAALEAFRPLLTIDGPDLLTRFQALQLAPGVEPPPSPPAPPPDWMAKRPAGLRAILGAFMVGDLELDRLRTFDRPVWFALGGRSNPDYYARMATRLAGVFPDSTIERFPDRHHFDPPHRIEPTRVAGSLHALWDRAEGAPGHPASPAFRLRGGR
jgi:pimeloyl-ACP methyl ester carboxylesterase